MSKLRNFIGICAITLLVGCSTSKEIQLVQANDIKPAIPDLFAEPCYITPLPDSNLITITEGLQLNGQLRVDLCTCALKYNNLITYSFDQSLEDPSRDQCPDL